MSEFPSEKNLASWAGLAPGNNESAGKKKSTRITHGNTYLKTTMLQAAWAASKTKDSYWQAYFKKLCSRMSCKKAAIALARKMLTSVYFMLDKKISYKELGANFVDEQLCTKRIAYHQRQLKSLGVAAVAA